MQRKVWFQLVDAATRDAYDGHTSDSLRVDPATVEDVDDLRTAIFDKLRQSLPPHVIPTMLRVFANGATYNAGQRLDEDTRTDGLGCTKTEALIVEVNASASARPIRSILSNGVSWLGYKGSTGESVDVDDPRTLPRTALVSEIIERLDYSRVLLVTSPPTTGKTSLASLVCREVETRSLAANTKVAVVNLTAAGSQRTLDERVRSQCGLTWAQVAALPWKEDCTVYVVLDEAQAIYEQRGQSEGFWYDIKFLLSHATRLRILMLATYGFSIECPPLCSPIQLPENLLLRSQRLNFTADEIVAYVVNWFNGVAVLRASSCLERFCDVLEALTGGHVGLCATTIGVLNRVWTRSSASAMPTADEWIAMLYNAEDDPHVATVHEGGLFSALLASQSATLPVDEPLAAVASPEPQE